MHEEVTTYIQQARQTGMSDEAIYEELRKAGWSQRSLQQALPGVEDTKVHSSLRRHSTMILIVIGLLFLVGAYIAYSLLSPSPRSLYKPIACVVSGGRWTDKALQERNADVAITLEARYHRCVCPENMFLDGIYCISTDVSSPFYKDDDNVTIEGYSNTYTHSTEIFSFMYPDGTYIEETDDSGPYYSVKVNDDIAISLNNVSKLGSLYKKDCVSESTFECIKVTIEKTYQDVPYYSMETTMIGNKRVIVLNFYDENVLRSKMYVVDIGYDDVFVSVVAAQSSRDVPLLENTITLVQGIIQTMKILKEPDMFSESKADDTWMAEKFSEYKPHNLDLYGITVRLPENWKVKEINRRPEPEDPSFKLLGHDCADYEIKDPDEYFRMTFSFACGYADGGALELPDRAVIVKRSGSEGYARIPFGPQYAYVKFGDTKVSDTKGTRTEVYYSNGVMFKSTKHDNLLGYISGAYSGPDTGKNAFFIVADKIALEVLADL